MNIDHQRVNKAVVTACRQKKKITLKLYFFFDKCSSEWQISHKKNIFNPNWFYDVEETIKLKIKALNCYKSELKSSPHPRSITGIKTLAKWRGVTVGFKFAEAFELGRKYE